MDSGVLYNVDCLFPGEGIRHGYIHIVEGRIASVGTGAPPLGLEAIDGDGCLLTPGLIDVHTHGIQDFNYDRGPDELKRAAEALGRYGVTTVVPTVVPSITPDFMETLSKLSDAIESIDQVHIPGLHLEGPFVAIAGAACDTREGDVPLLKEMIAACKGRVSIMSIAPEVPNIIPVIESLIDANIIPFITHTRATVEQTIAAVDAGARHATHFYDVFPVPEETDPGVRPVGVVETILGDPRATCDFICDGIHVHPMAIRAAIAAKGWEGVSLISDASFGAGLEPGRYETPWGYPVLVRPGNAPRIDDPAHPFYGALAGSALTMNRGVENLLDWLDLPREQIWAMATLNPANLLQQRHRGRIEIGAQADLVLWKKQKPLEPLCAWVGGKLTYDGRQEIDGNG